jgi:DNA-binding LacI/PurR family transcriptional regulator
VRTAREHGYNVIVSDTENLPRLEEEWIEVFRQRRVDGIILGSVFLRDPAVERLVAEGYPCIMYNRRLRSGRGNYVVLDNVRAGYDLTAHVIRLGHRHIGFVGSLPGLSTASERLRGYRKALRDDGLGMDPAFVRSGAFKASMARQAAIDLLKPARRPTAIVAGSDVIALGVLEAAASLGLEVPADLAVVGFDDIEVAGHGRIQLTTMAQDMPEMGRVTARGMLEIIRDPQHFARRPLQQILAPGLVIRRTCGALMAPSGTGPAG